MWNTNSGDRTLEGAEARLFAEALWDFVSELEVDEGVYVVPEWGDYNPQPLQGTLSGKRSNVRSLLLF